MWQDQNRIAFLLSDWITLKAIEFNRNVFRFCLQGNDLNYVN